MTVEKCTDSTDVYTFINNLNEKNTHNNNKTAIYELDLKSDLFRIVAQIRIQLIGNYLPKL